MSGAGKSKFKSFCVQQAITGGSELISRKFLAGHSQIEIFHDFGGRKHMVVVTDGFTHYQCLLDKYRQQRCGHAVTYDVGHIKSYMLLVNAHYIINVT